MRLRKSFIWYVCLLFCLSLILVLAACNSLPGISIGLASQTPTPTINTWNKGAPGVEVRNEIWKSSDGASDTVSIVRFDLHYIKLSVAYQPDQPLSMEDWMHKEQATALINGG